MRDFALTAMKRLPEHLKECQGGGDDDPPCVALLAYEEVRQREAALREALESIQGTAEATVRWCHLDIATLSKVDAIRHLARAALSVPTTTEEK